jgi:hypothetical protein
MTVARLLPLAALLAAAPALAQGPPPWAYYPLGVGDVWEYDEPSLGTTLRVHNVADTVIAGRPYVVQVRTRFDAAGTPSEAFPRSSLRYDTATAFVMWASFTMPGEEFEWWRVRGPLDAQPPRGGCGTGGGTVWEVMVYTADLTVGDTTVQDVRHKWFGINGGYYVLAAGLGEVLRQPKFDPPDVLVYARIGGVEYGSPLYTAADPPPAAPSALAVAVWPNPARGRVVVAFSLPEFHRARVEVVDLLGRRVADVDLGTRPAGQHEVALDLSTLAPGLYVVRVRAGTHAAAHRLAISG